MISKMGMLFGIVAALFFSQSAAAECGTSYCDDVRIMTLLTASPTVGYMY